MKHSVIVAALVTMISLGGCSAQSSNRDQLRLDVPAVLMERPNTLKKIKDQTPAKPPLFSFPSLLG